jgi:hypothetical protein
MGVRTIEGRSSLPPFSFFGSPFLEKVTMSGSPTNYAAQARAGDSRLSPAPRCKLSSMPFASVHDQTPASAPACTEVCRTLGLHPCHRIRDGNAPRELYYLWHFTNGPANHEKRIMIRF